MLSLFCVLVCVVAQPTVSASRAMALIILNETRICFIFLVPSRFAVVLEMISSGEENSRERCVDEPWRRERAVRPNEGTAKGGTHGLAVCTMPGQLDYFAALAYCAALALQQHGEQSALREREGRD